ncbi:glycoside hydrolase family 16 protein [Dactylosporangium darangshiense]
MHFPIRSRGMRHLSGIVVAIIAAALLVPSPAAAAASTSTALTLGTPSLSARPGENVTLRMRFDAVPMSEDYRVFVHFVNSNGAIAFGGDHYSPQAPTTWNGSVSYDQTVAIPSTAADGQYTIRVGLFQDHSPWDRATLLPGDGVTVDDELRYIVGTLTIGSTPRVLTLGTQALSGQAGQNVTLRMRFDAVPMSEDYRVFVHFVNSNGAIAFGGDHYSPQAPTTWNGSVSYDQTVAIPSTAADGQYTIRVGLFQDHSPWDRATLLPGDGVTVDDELRYIVGTLTIGAVGATRVLTLGTPSLSVQAGQAVTMRIRFDAVPMAEDYLVFIHVVDTSGAIVLNGGYHSPPTGTSAWSGLVSYDRTVTVPSTLSAGKYDIRVGLFQDHSPWDRVALQAGSGVSVDSGLRYLVGTLTVGGATTPPPTTSGPYGQNAANYRATFTEEFTSGGVDTSLWNDHIWYENSNSTINYKVTNGALKIWPQRDASGNFFNRTIDTDGKYYQTYGFFEMEAKLPVGKGAWPAFWLLNHDGDTRPEIDIMEAYSGGGPTSGWSDSNLHPTTFAATVWPTGAANPSAGQQKLATSDLSAAFHKYGLKWEPNRLTFYFDGQQFYTVNVSMSNRMYILLDLWFGSASGQPDGTTPTGESNSYIVNYVKAWQFQ